MYRELFEEVGLSRKDVRILASTRNWLRYKLPKRLVRWDTKPVCIGQKQKWFLLQLMSADAEINMQTSSTPEFDGWRWVSYWYPVRQVVSFKRDVYRRVMKEFASVVMALQDNPLSYKARLLIDVKRLSHANYAHSPARNSRKSGQCAASERGAEYSGHGYLSCDGYRGLLGLRPIMTDAVIT